MGADNPYLLRRKKRPNSGVVSERNTAKRLGGRQTPASGAMEGAKGDIHLDMFLIEAKSTKKASMSVKLDWLLKIQSEAKSQGKLPALTMTFVKADGSPVENGKYVIMREVDFAEVLDGLGE